MPHPSSARVGYRKSRLVFLQSSTKKGCPIQASLGWDTTNLDSSSLDSSSFNPARKKGAPSKLRSGGIPQISTRPLSTRPPSIQHEKRVPHPSSAWVGYHKSRLVLSRLVLLQSSTKKGCPIQAPLGWDTTNPSLRALPSRGGGSKIAQGETPGKTRTTRARPVGPADPSQHEARPPRHCHPEVAVATEGSAVAFRARRQQKRPRLGPFRRLGGCPTLATHLSLSLGWGSRLIPLTPLTRCFYLYAPFPFSSSSRCWV